MRRAANTRHLSIELREQEPAIVEPRQRISIAQLLQSLIGGGEVLAARLYLADQRRHDVDEREVKRGAEPDAERGEPEARLPDAGDVRRRAARTAEARGARERPRRSTGPSRRRR